MVYKPVRGGENLITLDPDPALQYMKVVGEIEPIAGQCLSKIGSPQDGPTLMFWLLETDRTS